MGKSLLDIAKELKDSSKKVQLIFAFNGTGKTRLSREFKELIASTDSEIDEDEDSGSKVIYYNAFTEDLFYWDNDLDEDIDRKLVIRPNGFTKWVLVDQGKENDIISHFQHYTSDKLLPRFSPNNSEVHFSIIGNNNEENMDNIKISKGEESNFIWCVFYSLFEEVIEVLNTPVAEQRVTNNFNDLKYVFIDDPVSSLDETHLIELAVNIADLIKSSTSQLKFIITTHNPLFYNVLFNEFNNKSIGGIYKPKHCEKRRLEKLGDGSFLLSEQKDDSPFSYHLFLLSELDRALETNEIQKYHFNFIRNILEKLSTFLGYSKWNDLLPVDARESYYNRIINLSSHGKFSSQESSIIDDRDKRVLSFLVNMIKTTYKFKIDNDTI